MIALWFVSLLFPTPAEAALARADELAARARAAPAGKEKTTAVRVALDGYAAVIRLRPKDARLVPRVRRRRASLLKHAGRPGDALREHDLIVAGRARRKDRARALYDGALLLERASDLAAAEARLRRALADFRDVVRVRAQAAFARGRVLEAMGRLRDAERAYRFVVDKCADQVKAAIGAYDALALLALRDDRPRIARRWLRACRNRYEKRALRKDKHGAFVARLLGEMKAPRELAKAAGT